METLKKNKLHGRVRQNTPESINRKIDRNIIKNLEKYSHYSKNDVEERLEKLRKEWDIEKMLEVNASALALTGIIFSVMISRKWLLLSGIVLSFLLQHGLQGWCPPLPLFRALGVRSRQEIDEEKYAMKILRGDFDQLSSGSGSRKILNILRKKAD